MENQVRQEVRRGQTGQCNMDSKKGVRGQAGLKNLGVGRS